MPPVEAKGPTGVEDGAVLAVDVAGPVTSRCLRATTRSGLVYGVGTAHPRTSPRNGIVGKDAVTGLGEGSLSDTEIGDRGKEGGSEMKGRAFMLMDRGRWTGRKLSGTWRLREPPLLLLSSFFALLVCPCTSIRTAVVPGTIHVLL